VLAHRGTTLLRALSVKARLDAQAVRMTHVIRDDDD